MFRKLLGSGLAAAIVAGGCLAGTASAGPPPAVTASAGAGRALPPGFFGINYDYGGASVYINDHNVLSQLATLAPGTLRWPAGTGANYFQWGLGYPVQAAGAATGHGNCASPKEGQSDGFRFTLADLAAAARRSGATPVFDLNVMTATLDSQIAMLKTARDRYRLPVRYVELGNEFYLCTADYVAAFPAAADYGRLVAADTAALHRAFPGVLVAAVGSLPGKTARTQGWNAGLLGSTRPDVVTLHDHPEFNMPLTSAGLPALFAIPYTSAHTVAAATRQLGGIAAWITEYGLSQHWQGGNPAQLTYANALFEDEAAILLGTQVGDATLIQYWSAFGPGVNYAYTSSGQSPAGLAMQWLDQAARGARSIAPVLFRGGPVLASGDPALVGAMFTGPWTRHALLLNLTGQPVTIAAGPGIWRGAGYQQASADPVSQIRTSHDLRFSSGSVGRTVTLRPWSVTLIG